MDEVTRGTFLRAKQQVTVALDLLNWLTGHPPASPGWHRLISTAGRQKDPPPGGSLNTF
ncbi:hypothetical protein M8J71_11130 [Pseudarthrobacter sp. R1]|uniref:hypothetical protein n=1 Tax=Pseudarthrobacter sp. R1 TaxID=2944934 RepID=UPI002108635B|nr:hypothetical protein [Pseudarthrobacter sp. R1]MCQ6271035.1 hypothetical protein [Pseudarthrobacter sp. R1]